MSDTPHFSTHATTTNKAAEALEAARSTAAPGNADALHTVDRLAATKEKKVTSRPLSHEI